MSDSNPLAATDLAYIATCADAGVKYRDIAAAIDRPLGTVKTALFRLRRDGLVGRRYAEWDRADA